ncbi:hypothetical protein Lalb_Chr19g0132681 [Lupinus albus]|uniref:Encoded peptide n=1 Tax=Lupinus albus TaxID=3870 RepID=A0A6A4NY17_LUPAL|nr:hypothetical protein Lalb_Chr19g0132681 [Lupinus albus]
MKSLCSLLIVAFFATTLMFSLPGVNMSQAMTHPKFPSSQSLSDRDGSKSSHDPVVAASLRKIPPSRPNPTQNK